jgi:hypothetical protein
MKSKLLLLFTLTLCLSLPLARAQTQAALEASGGENTANGVRASVQILNTDAGGGDGWELRVGATGTNTPAAGFSIANAVGYWLIFESTGQMGIGVTDPTHRIDVNDGAYENDGVWTNASDRNLKENFAPVDGTEVLSKIDSLPIDTWSYKSNKSVRHLGPVAQDFYSAFGLGQDEKHISTVDEGGVALAGVQQPYRMIQQKDKEIATLNQANHDKDAQIQKLRARVEQLQQVSETVRVLAARLAKLEASPEPSLAALRTAY